VSENVLFGDKSTRCTGAVVFEDTFLVCLFNRGSIHSCDNSNLFVGVVALSINDKNEIVVGKHLEMKEKLLSMVKRGSVAHAILRTSNDELCLVILNYNQQNQEIEVVARLPFQHSASGEYEQLVLA
jgi:hypothetical protein